MAKKSTGKKIRLYAPLSTPAIGVGDELFEVAPDGTVEIPAEREAEFKKMGCTRKKPS